MGGLVNLAGSKGVFFGPKAVEAPPFSAVCY